MAQLTVGPVIGKVTESSARVLVEADADVRVTVLLRAGDSERTARADLEANRPRAVTVRRLAADTTYSVRIRGADADVEGRVRTLPRNASRLNVGAVSCNFTIKLGDDEDPWVDLRDRYVNPGHLDLLLHLGDQIYGDHAFDESLAELPASGRPRASVRRAIEERYRRLYRLAWGAHRPTREVLARVSNLSIWDDHEITDDWGSRPAHADPDSRERIIGDLARKVYREYQRQLWEDAPDPPEDGLEHHVHRFGKIGVLFVDQRGGRSFARDRERPYLSRAQWEAITAALAPGGTFARVRALLVVTSVPLTYLGDRITEIGSGVIDDLMDHWAYGPHRKEQIEFVRALRAWKQARDGERELLVLGGDVHIGGETQVYHGESPLFRQLITSPMTNKPPNSLLFFGLRALLAGGDTLGESYSFEHENLTRRRNYGIVLVRVPASGTPRVEGSLVEV